MNPVAGNWAHGKARTEMMRGLKLGLLLGLALLSTVIACAQDAIRYRLHPQDEILIQVYNEAQINSVLPVLPDGRISAPFVGLIEVGGKTTAEVEEVLTGLYKEKLKLRDPKVSVVIVRYRPIKASVAGMVQAPGSFNDFKPGETILNLLSRGGSVNPDRADLRRATLSRAGSREVIPIDLNAMLYRNDLSQNYEIEDGDTLWVPEGLENRINITGAIQQPGTYPYKEPMYLSDIVGQARGPVANRAKMSEVLIIRRKPGTTDQLIRIKSNYVNFIRKGDIAQNVQLMPGDVIFVPETKTPDYNQIGTMLNTLFIVDRLFTGGFLGLKLFGN